MVALSFCGSLRKWEVLFKKFRHKFFSIISFSLLQSKCFSLSVQFRLFRSKPFLNFFQYIDTRKLHVRLVVPKLQTLILPVTGRVVLLVHFIVPNLTISPQNPQMIWITIMLRSTVPKPDVSFKFKLCYQGFHAYVNIEKLNTECKADQEHEMWIWNT